MWSLTNGPRAGWPLTACAVLAPPAGWSFRCSQFLTTKSCQSDWYPSNSQLCVQWDMPSNASSFYVNVFVWWHWTVEGVTLPAPAVLSVLVTVPHCRVLPQMPSQGGWRLPSTPASLLLCASIPTHPRESGHDIFWLLEAALVPGDEAAGSSSPPAHPASFLMSLQGRLRGSGRGCWDAAIGRKRHRTSPLLLI